jgi:hypothetical protein
MEHLLGIFSVWVVLALAYHWLTAPEWSWHLFAIALGCGWELLVEPSTWWLGIGVGGGAVVLRILTDLFTVLTDNAKLAVLRHSRGRP